jgi:hypothetical protein
MEKEYIDAIINLNWQTQDQILKWKVAESPIDSIRNDEQLIGTSFETEPNKENSKLRLYKYRKDTPYQTEISYRLEILDLSNKIEFTFPYFWVIADLYDTVEIKVSNFRQKIQGFLTNH